MKRAYIVLFLCCSFAINAQKKPKSLTYIMDMVHHIPGEQMYESRYNNPAIIKEMGFNSKVFFLYDSPMLAINWDEMDKDILPIGSLDRTWVDAKKHRLDSLYAISKKNGIDVYAMSDLVLFPKRLVDKYGMQTNFGDISNPMTEKCLRFQLNQMFKQFPQFDGMVVRIGETYLHDAPYHKGNIQNKMDAERCIIPLMNILRDEVCIKLNKKVIFRTWWSFDENEATYRAVDKAVEPHKNLVIGVKHCEGDFIRANPFSKILGVGRHQQIVEVQCAREYEGKGAFPNYIAHGVIDGFEEHAPLKVQGKLWNLKGLQASGKLAGVWTWSRGGGWEGPYIKNELWCDLNTWVMAQWANNPSESEKSIFNRYATTRLGLSAKDAIKFRKLAILSEKAVLRGRRSLAYPTALYRIWTRDEYVSFPRIPQHADTIAVVLKEKDEAIKMWNEIVKLAKQIKFKDKTTTNFVVSSSLYGLEIHRIYRSIIYLAAIKAGLINDSSIKNYIAQYDNAWQNLYLLSDKYPDVCASLYSKSTCRRITEFTTESEPADNMVNFMRNEYINSTMISKPQTSISKQ